MRRTFLVTISGIPCYSPLPKNFDAAEYHDWIMDNILAAWKDRPERLLFDVVHQEVTNVTLWGGNFVDNLPQIGMIWVNGEITDENAVFLMLKYNAVVPDNSGMEMT